MIIPKCFCCKNPKVMLRRRVKDEDTNDVSIKTDNITWICQTPDCPMYINRDKLQGTWVIEYEEK